VRRLVRGIVRRLTGYDVVRIVLGSLLLIAAGLKAHQLATEPVLSTGLLDSRWLLMATVELELLFGLWLLGNIWPKPTWAMALACFGLFTCVSLYKALSGDANCGCFGRVSVNPWYTATLDLSAVFSLLLWRPKGRESVIPLHFGRLPRQAVAVLAVWLCVGLPAALAMGSYTDATLSEAGEIVGDGKIVVLKPETWVGKRFPLLGHTDIGSRLARGMSLVLLHRHDCSACREAATQYEALAKDFSARTNCPTVALLECPPYAENGPTAEDASLVTGRLSDAEEWRLSGPESVLIDDGRVQSVFKNARDVELVKAIWGTGDS
jgi:hypothetical protein